MASLLLLCGRLCKVKLVRSKELLNCLFEINFTRRLAICQKFSQMLMLEKFCKILGQFSDKDSVENFPRSLMESQMTLLFKQED